MFVLESVEDATTAFHTCDLVYAPDADYSDLHKALERLGAVVELPFESTFVIRSDDRTDVQTLGRALGELCPDDSLMVTGVNHDWAYSDAGVNRMFVADAAEFLLLRPF